MKKFLAAIAIIAMFITAPAFAAWECTPSVKSGSGPYIVHTLSCVSDGAADTYTFANTTGLVFYAVETVPGTLGAAWDITITDSTSGVAYLAKQAVSQTATEVFIGSTTTGQYPLIGPGNLKIALDPDGDLTATNDVVIHVKFLHAK